MNKIQNKVIIKVNLLGDGAVGKTSLRNRFMGKGFRQDHLMTIAADFAVYDKDIVYNDKTYHAIFQIWDMAGQAKFQQLRARFFQGSMGGLMVFDITREESFASIPKWIEELWRNSGQGVIPLVMIGNKSDLRNRKSIPVKKAEEYAKMLSSKTVKHGFNVPYLETSAKDGINIDVAFETLGKQIISRMINKQTKR